MCVCTSGSLHKSFVKRRSAIMRDLLPSHTTLSIQHNIHTYNMQLCASGMCSSLDLVSSEDGDGGNVLISLTRSLREIAKLLAVCSYSVLFESQSERGCSIPLIVRGVSQKKEPVVTCSSDLKTFPSN